MPKLPEKIEDWTAPWDKEGAEFDPAQFRKFAWDLLKDQEKNRAKIAEDKVALGTLTTERDAFKDKAEAKGGDDDAKSAEILQLKQQVRERDTQLEKVKDYDKVVAERDRYEIGLDEGLTKTLAKRLVGADRDELLADAAELKTDLGFTDDGQRDGSGTSGADRGAGGQYQSPFEFSGTYRTGGQGLDHAALETDPSKVKLPPV